MLGKVEVKGLSCLRRVGWLLPLDKDRLAQYSQNKQALSTVLIKLNYQPAHHLAVDAISYPPFFFESPLTYLLTCLSILALRQGLKPVGPRHRLVARGAARKPGPTAWRGTPARPSRWRLQGST